MGAAHVPDIDEPDWEPLFYYSGPRFVSSGGRAKSEAGRSDFLICRSGERSKAVGQVLLEAEVDNVFSIIDGFEGPLNKHDHRSRSSGWQYDGLPWTQC